MYYLCDMLFIDLHKNSKVFGSDQINHEYINDIFLLNNTVIILYSKVFFNMQLVIYTHQNTKLELHVFWVLFE